MIIALQTLVFFRESIFNILDRLLRPYYRRFSLTFSRNSIVSSDEDDESEEQVFSEIDDERGVVFYPPMYVQRYAAVSDCLMDDRWRGKLEKIVDLGYHDMSFIKYLQETPGVKCIMGVDIDSIPLLCSSELTFNNYPPKSKDPLQITLFQGNAADPDYRLIGCDAVIAIEMIEHMLPHDLDRLVHNVFGFIKPWIAIFTTPNGDFNVLFKALEKNGLRRLDHFFEWTREQFNDWCGNIVVRYPEYTVFCKGIGPGPPSTEHIGCCSQMALFVAKDYHKQQDLNLDSLALVANTQVQNNISDMISSWEIPAETFTENNMLCKANRLNCTTLQVKKFSKTTQNLMTKNKLDSLSHTREVVDEIRQLRRMLNFNKDSVNQPEENNIWCNINWGENAPYWNQYYKVVREFRYPYETKSDECRVLDLISDEINRLIDNHYDEEFAVDVNKLEIPIEHLMQIVTHITNDVEKVKELLEWNGYEIVDNVVIHSRLVVDAVSLGSQDDWLEDDTLSDCYTDHTTDLRSTTISDGSTIVPDYHGRCLRRALNHKVRSLRKTLSADEDITAELDRVVCRLMMLALRSSRGRRNPLPARWMQCKLLDLLTLTEKAIERRKRHFIESFPLKAIDFGIPILTHLTCFFDIHNSCHAYSFVLKAPDITLRYIVYKYRHLVNEDHFGYVNPTTIFDGKAYAPKFLNTDETNLERTQAWVEEDIEVVSYPYHDNFKNSSGFTEIDNYKYKETHRSCKVGQWDNCEDTDVVLRKKYKRKVTQGTKVKNEDKRKGKSSNSKIVKKVSQKKSSCRNLFRNSSNKLVTKEYGNYGLRVKRTKERHRSPSSKPIPKSLIELCHPEMQVTEDVICTRLQNNSPVDKLICDIATTEESFLIDIIMEDHQETISLRRTIATDTNDEQETLIKSISDHIHTIDSNCGKNEIITENVPSQTIFLNDINEPSTSKGIRHNSTNAQCGPDDIQYLSVLSTATSFHALPKTISRCNIGELYMKNSDFGTSMTDEYSFNRSLTIKMKSIGIRIKDSDTNNSYVDNILYSDVKDTSSNFVLSTSDIKNTKSVGIHVTDSIKNIHFNEQNLHKDSTNTDDFIQVTHYTQDKLCPPMTGSVEIHNRNFGLLDISGESGIQNYPINKKYINFILTPQENYQINTEKKSFGIHIKDSNIILDKVECSTMTDDTTNDFKSDETKLLKLASTDLKIVDSTSDFNESVGSRKSPSHTALFRSLSDLKLKLSASRELQKLNTNKYIRSKLCCGGVHVHSYKDKKVSEDVVYQGEWQSYRPKASAKKKPQVPSLSKKATESKCIYKKTNSKEKISSKIATNKEIKPISKKPIAVPDMTTARIRPDICKMNKQNWPIKNDIVLTPVPKVNKPLKSVTRVASKIKMSSISSKTKIPYQAKMSTIVAVSFKKEGTKPQNLSSKNYIPPYLKRNLEKIQQSRINNITPKLDIVGKSIKINKERSISSLTPIVHEKTEQIRKDLLKFDVLPRENISYLVFRNEIENKENGSVGQSQVDKKSSGKKNDSINKRACSSPSQNSSTCSSPNSIATVRQASKRPKTFKKSSNISRKSSIGTSGSENTTPNKNKKIVKRAKSTKKSIDNVFDNKENVPQTSGQYNKEIERKSLGSFVGRHNSVFIAQVKKDSTSLNNSVSKDKTLKKSNIKIPTVESSNTLLKSVTHLGTSKKSLNSELVLSDEENEKFITKSDMTLVLEPHQKINEVRVESTEMEKNVDNSLLTERLNSLDNNLTQSHPSTMMTIRQLIDETLDSIITSLDINNSFDSETVILSQEDLNESPKDSSLQSYKTAIVIENNINTIIESDLENALNRTFDSTIGNESIISLADTGLSLADDLDTISFKSITIVSKYSDYFLADNELDNSNSSHKDSVRDIFDRKDHIVSQKPPGPLTLQMFSGFSLNAESIVRDRFDAINLIDSETGSLAVEIPRQATSEELFVSGRSSGSYESCILDEDSVVPNWLFRIISQQQSNNEDETAIELVIQEAPVVLPIPISDPMIDANGNVLEPVLGVGAGDGRGMHSDNSQDSSGRGTSLSSTDTSSGQQSEAILVDPFTGQFELLGESIDSAVVIPNFIDEAETSDNATTINEVLTNPLLAASDFDADVSSLDTDVPDFSDN
ncbi:hypothetical protein K1T71_003070 [Dendrolimus kikuchii]|uniref:Uncharacterized protein n=1 Tax=Dendrolimus kikuchii TaxID=765133 RepID=A0ACC1DAX6_9NEOP|nr:hypothetical protein K1T71_003070 [Dendrolimus kikuchii]